MPQPTLTKSERRARAIAAGPNIQPCSHERCTVILDLNHTRDGVTTCRSHTSRTT